MIITHKFPAKKENRQRELRENGWKKIKEPRGLFTATLLSVPFMILCGVISFLIMNAASPISLSDYGFTGNSISITIPLTFFLWLLVMLIVHELLHLIFVPDFWKSKKTYIGLTFFGGYVYTEEKMSKTRFLFITVAPFVILSIFLPAVLGMLGLLTPMIIFLVLLNAMASSVDMLNFFLIQFQIPGRSVVQSNGTDTYWKETTGV
ncbi:hypothetical protein CR205_09230 [Alteribacter lacisalsi]|uniref:DUF3267 domain-containing protein n=1 Tax=Alteribacter lacisalsi TaxID=2045244 RepID=A0A2W0HY67_9BACI|nr:DUF3267 domain-containing protein [Alteribacter lacisalsi]PYZ98738.1 hypothetical protein CR205_09230 [Alteribacter lacisalsi]